MAGEVKAAQNLVASMGGTFDRSAVVRWGALKDKATGKERQLIQWMSEAFHPMVRTEEDRRWLAAFMSGIPMDDVQDPVRSDTEEQVAQEATPEIDWANVASEAAAMVELNKGATASWQGDQPKEEDS